VNGGTYKSVTKTATNREKGQAMSKRKRTENPNANCLYGWKCPDCHSYGPFEISVTFLCTMTDEGTEEYYGDTNYDRDSFARCIKCSTRATVRYFQEN
jgi:hypothetical protein